MELYRALGAELERWQRPIFANQPTDQPSSSVLEKGGLQAIPKKKPRRDITRGKVHYAAQFIWFADHHGLSILAPQSIFSLREKFLDLGR